jgi:anti-sigma regulatory factor (Ser/Thr protein kinase)
MAPPRGHVLSWKPHCAGARVRRAQGPGRDGTGRHTKDTTTPTRDRPHRPPRPTVGLPRRRLQLTGDAASLRVARQLVGRALAECEPELRDAAVLLVGEVVTNAVVHGGGRFLLHVDATPERLRVEVTDAGDGDPKVLQMTGDREHGRGMAIVDALATTWGTDRLGRRKTVWFELAAHP